MLTNDPTVDVAGATTGVAVVPVARGDAISSVFIETDNNDVNSTVYTVPAERYIEGWVHPDANNYGNYVEVKVNGGKYTVMYSNGNSNGSPREHKLSLGPGDILSIGSNNHCSMTFNGILRKL